MYERTAECGRIVHATSMYIVMGPNIRAMLSKDSDRVQIVLFRDQCEFANFREARCYIPYTFLKPGLALTCTQSKTAQ